jgi:hypothetical protein
MSELFKKTLEVIIVIDSKVRWLIDERRADVD